MRDPQAAKTLMMAAVTLLLPALLPAVPPQAAPAEGKDDAVILEETLEVEILSDSEARVRFLNRTQVMTPRGVEMYLERDVDYNPSTTIRDLRASVTSPSGKRVDLKKKEFSDHSDFASYQLYSDSRQRSIHFPGVEPGSILEYSYEKSLRGLFYIPNGFYFQRGIPARRLSYTVRAPVSFPLEVSVRGTPTYTREEREGTIIHHWEAKDVPAFRDELGTLPYADLLPLASVYPHRLSFGDLRIDAETWGGIARWYMDLARDKMEPSPEVAEAARAATAGVSDPEEKTRLLYEFLQQKIKYVAVHIGIGGFQPHENGQVLLNRYGDCKDKATLLIAMMRAVGLTGFPVLIRTRTAGLIEKEHPSSDFNHAIVAIPRSEGYLFLDPTAENTPYGDLPWTDQGVPVLVVRDDGSGDFVETPLSPPERNRRHRRVTARVTPAGGLEGEYVIEAWGERRVALSESLDEARSSEREDMLEQILAWLCPGAILKGHEVTPAAGPGDPVKITVRFEVPRFVMKAGASELITPQLARFPQFARLTVAGDRRLPIFFEYLFTDTSEIRLTLPPGRTLAKVPAGRKSEGPGLLSTTTYEILREGEGETLVVKRDFTISRREIPPADYPALRDFFSALAREDAGAVALVEGS